MVLLSIVSLTTVGFSIEMAPPPVGPLSELSRAAAGEEGGFTGDPSPNLVAPLETVMLMIAEANRPSATSVYDRTTVAAPIFAGLNARPLSAAFRAASVPSI